MCLYKMSQIFGKSYNVRPGARTMQVKNPNLKNPKIGSLPVRDQNKSFGAVRRPGSIIQDPIPKIYDFDKARKDDIFKFGTKVNLGNQLDFTFKESDGTVVTKKLSELSYDAGKKLEELKAISAVGNKGLEEKMELLNTLVGEITGKFEMLSNNDMFNISKILTNMGEKIVLPADVGLQTRYLTQKGYEDLKNNAEDFDKFIIYLAGKLDLNKRIATRTDESAIKTNQELSEYFEEKQGETRIMDLVTMKFFTFSSWRNLQTQIYRSGRDGLLDGVEYDDHPITKSLQIKRTAAASNKKIEDDKKLAKLREPVLKEIEEEEENLFEVNAEIMESKKNIIDFQNVLKTTEIKLKKLKDEKEILKKNPSGELDKIKIKIKNIKIKIVGIKEDIKIDESLLSDNVNRARKIRLSLSKLNYNLKSIL
jgi:hypothetical protein